MVLDKCRCCTSPKEAQQYASGGALPTLRIRRILPMGSWGIASGLVISLAVALKILSTPGTTN